MKKYLVIFVMSICFSFLLFPRTKEPENLQLSLMDCILTVLKDNLEIAVLAYDPEIAEFTIKQAQDIYWPKLNFGYSNYNYNYLTNWAVQGTNYVDKTLRYDIGVRQKIITGGEIELSLLTQSSNTTRALTIINPNYRGELSFNFTQPILKGFGPKINMIDITKAKNLRDISVIGLKSNLVQKVYEVEEVYWNLVYALENLKVYEMTLRQNLERLDQVKEAERVGVKSSLEVLRTETEVANYENSVLAGQTQVEMFQDRMKSLLNFPTETEVLKSIIPTERPILEKVDISFEDALKTAYAESPEMERYQKEIENTKLEVAFQKNQLLPQLDLRASLWFPGQSGDILVFKDNNPYTGIVVDRIKGGRMDSFRDVFDFKYKNWYVTLNLTVPFETLFSRSNLAKAKLEEEKKLMEREKIEKEIYYNIREAYKELKNREKQIETAAKYRELTEKRMRAEEERYNLGLVGNEWLFQYQRDLAQARVSEIKALIDYKIAIAKLERVMGVNLKNKNLKYKQIVF